jgi:hypothetical protein
MVLVLLIIGFVFSNLALKNTLSINLSEIGLAFINNVPFALFKFNANGGYPQALIANILLKYAKICR